MSDYMPFIISGLVTGSVYGLAGVGLVLTYKISGVFNFAQGALATVSAYVFYTLYVQHGLAWPLAAAISIFVLGPIIGLLFERLARVLDGQALAVQAAATVGILLIVQAAVVLIYGQTEVRSVPVFLAQGDTTILGATVRYSDIITFVVAVAATAGLYLFFRLSRLGVGMRAVVDNADLVSLSGTNATTVRRYGWIIGVVFASLCGVLFSSLLPLDPVVLTFLIIQAFGAAALGAFRSLPLTFIGGLVIGVVASLSTKWFTSGILAGVPPAVPFIALFLVLLFFPRRYLSARSRLARPRPSSWRAPWQMQAGGGVLLLIGLLLVPSFAGIHLTDWTTALATAVVFLSLGLLVRTSGQVSLCHVTFMAIGAAAFSHLSTDGAHLPWLPALLVAGLIAVPVGMVLAIPAIRLTGLYLALATFGFAVVVAYVFYSQGFMFGAGGTALTMPRPSFATGDKAFYFTVLGFVVLMVGFVVALERSRLGRLLRGMEGSAVALETSGATVNVTRVLVFCISAFIAAVAGAFAGMSPGVVSVDSYPPLLSLTYLALIMIVVGGTPWYSLIAGGSLILIPVYVSGHDTASWLQLLFGVAAVAFALTPDSARGVPAPIRDAIDRFFGRANEEEAPAVAPRPAPVEASRRAPAVALEGSGVTVRFGGLVAVNDVTLSAPTGRITGLIGPNGAGKTTMFNTFSGLVRPAAGDLKLADRALSRRSASARARMGLGRTFQQMELFDSMTVWENVAMGREGGLAGANPVRHLLPNPSDGALVAGATTAALESCGLGSVRGAKVGDLSTGQRRLVELARCIAGDSRMLLLDEPSSGLDHRETGEFGEILTRVVRERDVGILLVEHDMSLVMDVCEYIYVLDFGRLIFGGTPAEVRASQLVQAAYLGGDEVEDSVAGGDLAPQEGAAS